MSMDCCPARPSSPKHQRVVLLFLYSSERVKPHMPCLNEVTTNHWFEQKFCFRLFNHTSVTKLYNDIFLFDTQFVDIILLSTSMELLMYLRNNIHEQLCVHAQIVFHKSQENNIDILLSELLQQCRQ